MLSALEIIAHFDPLMWIVENPGHRAAEDPAVHGASALGGRDLLHVRDSVQEADAACGPTCAGGRGEACASPAAAARRGMDAPPGRAGGGRG